MQLDLGMILREAHRWPDGSSAVGKDIRAAYLSLMLICPPVGFALHAFFKQKYLMELREAPAQRSRGHMSFTSLSMAELSSSVACTACKLDLCMYHSTDPQGLDS